jgi:hypothetical protein
MYTLKKHLVLALALIATGACATQEKSKNSIRKSTKQLVRATAQDVHGAVCATARGADHLLYPVLCALAGKGIYDKGVSRFLPKTPEQIQALEQKVPGLETGKHALTYVALGGALCVGLNYVSNIPAVNDFLRKNMPHLSSLLQHVKIDLSSEVQPKKLVLPAKRK